MEDREKDARAAEILGWRITTRRPPNLRDWSNYPDVWYETPKGHLENVTNVPAFGSDANHAALLMRALTPEQRRRFIHALLDIIDADVEEATRDLWYVGIDDWMAALLATPAQLRDAALEAVEGGKDGREDR